MDSSGIDLGEHLMGLEDEFTEFFTDISDRKLKDQGYPHVELSPKSIKDSNEVESAVAESDFLMKTAVSEEFFGLDSRSMVNVLDAGMFCNGDVPLSGGGTKCANLVSMNLDLTKSKEEVGKLCDIAEVKSEVGESGRGKKNEDYNEDVMILDPSTVQEVSSSRKRKQELCASEVGESRRGKKNDDSNGEVTTLDPSTVDEVSSVRKRKQESLCGMLNWVRMIAKDPCDPAVGSLPERSKWKSFGNEENWMQVLQAREAIFLKRHADSGAELSNWQKNHRMHPSMYDELCGSSYNFRERLRLGKKLLSGGTKSQSGACSESSSDLDKSCNGMAGMEDQSLRISELDRYPPSRIPLGKSHQACLPEWTGKSSESDLKWLRSRTWPLEKPEQRYLIERDPIGKGRQESCGCQLPGSIECVRFHISEKRLRVKRELGPAFYLWGFNQMGEEVGLHWTAEEEKKFEDIIKSNPPSLGTTFWDEIFESFAEKSRRDMVSYYFNVLLLQHRGYQNRFTPKDINSDDEELELGSVTAVV